MKVQFVFTKKNMKDIWESNWSSTCLRRSDLRGFGDGRVFVAILGFIAMDQYRRLEQSVDQSWLAQPTPTWWIVSCSDRRDRTAVIDLFGCHSERTRYSPITIKLRVNPLRMASFRTWSCKCSRPMTVSVSGRDGKAGWHWFCSRTIAGWSHSGLLTGSGGSLGALKDRDRRLTWSSFESLTLGSGGTADIEEAEEIVEQAQSPSRPTRSSSDIVELLWTPTSLRWPIGEPPIDEAVELGREVLLLPRSSVALGKLRQFRLDPAGEAALTNWWTTLGNFGVRGGDGCAAVDSTSAGRNCRDNSCTRLVPARSLVSPLASADISLFFFQWFEKKIFPWKQKNRKSIENYFKRNIQSFNYFRLFNLSWSC